MAAPVQATIQPTNGHIQGDVDVAPGVAIASGVLLGAAPGCRLVIASGVCLGADAVVQARQGDLILEIGVSLGSGVLVVGHGSIGQHTCIGANSTIINPRVGAAQAIAPGSLLGDPTETAPDRESSSNGATPGDNPGRYGTVGNAVNGLGNAAPGGAAQNVRTFGSGVQSSSAQNSAGQNGSSVYGKTQVNRLLATLFPQRQALNGASPEDRS